MHNTNKGRPLRRGGDRKPLPASRYDFASEHHGHSTSEGTFPGCDLTPEQVEFGRAMERWMRQHGRPHAVDVLAVAKSLGYRRVE